MMNHSGADEKDIANAILNGADEWVALTGEFQAFRQLLTLANHVKESAYNEPREWTLEATALAYGLVAWNNRYWKENDY